MKAAYDHIVVGSSPACLAEAAYHASGGQSVLLLERRDRLGGAWSTIEIPGFERVEFGAHLIANYATLYDNMNRWFGLDMALLASQPQYVTRDSIFKNSDKIWLWKDLRRLGRELLSADPKAKASFKYILNYYPRSFLKFLQYNGLRVTGYHYPRQGTFQMVSNLASLAQRKGADIALNAGVASVALVKPDARLQVTLDDGKEIEAQWVTLPSNTCIPRIAEGDEAVDLPSSKNRSLTLFLVIEDKTAASLSYLHFSDEPLLIRVSDITPYVLQSDSAAVLKLIAVQIHPQVADTGSGYLSENDVQYIFKLLRARQLLGADALLWSHHWYVYERQVSNWKALKKPPFQNLAARIRTLNTSTLSDSFLEGFPKWESAFANALP